MADQNSGARRIVNVFITHKHSTGQVYIEDCRRLLEACMEYTDECDGFYLINDLECLEAGDDYSLLNDFYDITDLDILILSEGVKESKWVLQEIDSIKARGIPVIPVFCCGGDINDVLPENVDSRWIDISEGRQPTAKDLRGLASKMKVHTSKERAAAMKRTLSRAKTAGANGNIISKLTEAVSSGAVEAAADTAKTVTKYIIIAAVILLIAAIAGITVPWDELLQKLMDRLLCM